MSDPAITEHCEFFVQRKKRYCRMSVKTGNRFCGEHLENITGDDIESRVNSKLKRIPCPIDSSHSCYESRLARHLKVCNAKRLADARPSYIIEGINLGDTHEDPPSRVPLSELDQLRLISVIKKIEAAYEKLPTIDEEILCDDVFKDRIADESYGRKARKHLLQSASLLGHAKRAGLARDGTCFVEFGAGKGKLAYWLARTMVEKPIVDSSVLLVDRSSLRHKSDNKLKNEKLGRLGVSRIRADIADLSLSKVPEIHNERRVVGVAKHLCGAATDLTIRCLAQLACDDKKSRVSGLIVAFCCHHRCDYASYVGKQYLHDSGFEKDEFSILCSIGSWATCAIGGKNSEFVLEDEEKRQRIVERESVGRKVKSLLNQGRVEYLKSLGFRVKLVYYISCEISLENMCMIAVFDES